MLATSTHDTKRSEDVRVRIGMLSEIPAAWADAVRRWSALNTNYRSSDLPDRKTEYLLYQTLVGAWPISKERLFEYARKAVREAKEKTSWINPNAAFEEGLEKFVGAILENADFVNDLEVFLKPMIHAARTTSLALNLLKLAAPGVPDIYQGAELWDLSLVDPDNRRRVDFAARRKLLAELDRLCPDQILARFDEGLPKLWLLRQSLRARNSRSESFAGSYQPLWASGPKAAHVIAFQRGVDIIAAVPRLSLSLGACDGTVIEIPDGHWRNQFTGESVQGGKIEMNALFANFPVALLARESE